MYCKRSEVNAINITVHFADLSDPRLSSNAQLHRFDDILVIALCAMLCGAESFVDMAAFGRAREEWLIRDLGLGLARGVPSHDTFARVFARLDPTEFAACFGSWTQSLRQNTGGEVIALDGKTLRRSFDSASGKGALHLVSAWANSNRLVLGQLAVDGKSNEMKAVPALLKLLDVKGCIVTADALNCQKEIAGQIVSQKGDYLLALKNNHRYLFEDVVNHFDWALGRVAKGVESQTLFSSYAETSNFGHGRNEKRRCWCVALSEISDGIENQNGKQTDDGWDKVRREWLGLRTLVFIESQRSMSQTVPEVAPGRTVWSSPHTERRYYLTSLDPNAEKILAAVREHWGIENSLHWVLDVVFNEDASRIRKDHAPKNMAMLRHLALNILRLDTSHKAGLKSKRLRAGWDTVYLKALLAGNKV